ncbi:hypothetical protein BTJ40_15355 [Microbulbifer sp. A4B17]|uniref:DUF6531 domain-containing protein n=1 Tax=Microbulbifer sp. A4B17 TaxID=359370 RepID=UPI000D52D56C|nr:DUF6531 domain-containing protein [Microbulbifer sp. A4B17]AWF82096.1 hypothetical protein BTJ40_15355 [Microbulbifer sp. A4B17]
MIQLYIENFQGARYVVRAGWTYEAHPKRVVDATELLGMFDTNTLKLIYDQYLGIYNTPTPDTKHERNKYFNTQSSNVPGHLNDRDKAIYLALMDSRLIIEEAPLPHSVLGDLQTELVAKIRMGLQQVIVQQCADKALTNQVVNTKSDKSISEDKVKVILKGPSRREWSLPIWSKSVTEVKAVVSPARQSFEFSTEAIDYVLYDKKPEKVSAECVTSLYRGVVGPLGFNPDSVSKKQLRLSFNIAEVIYSDPILRGAVFRFAQDYIKTKYGQSLTELTESGTFEIILTIALAALTEGDVSVESLTKNTRLVNAFRSIGNLMFDFARLKKQRKLLAKNPGYSTGKEDVGISGNRTPKLNPRQSNSRGFLPVNDNSGLAVITNSEKTTKKSRQSHNTNSSYVEINEVTESSLDRDNYCSETGENYSHNICQKSINTCEAGNSINLKTGEVNITLVDVELRGPLPLSITRTYRSGNLRDFGLGYGWSHSLSERLVWRPGKPVLFFDAEGRIISLPAPGDTSRSHNISEQLTLTRVNDEHWIVTSYGTSNGVQKHFKAIGKSGTLKLAEICDDYGNFYFFHYIGERLASIESSFGETLLLTPPDENPESHQISTLTKKFRDGSSRVIARYIFDSESNLIEAVDRKGSSEKYEYHQHIITQRTLKTSYRLHFQWDIDDFSTRCVRQWGDPINGKAIYNYQFSWDSDGHGVTVSDTGGAQQRFRFNGRALPTYYRDVEGRVTLYHYTDLGQITRIQLPGEDGTTRDEVFRYDNLGRLIQTVDNKGNNYPIKYNEKGFPIKFSDPSGKS